MNNYPEIILKKGKEISLKRKHHWVFSGAIHQKPNTLEDGDLVKILTAKSQVVGIGFYSPGSIMVRMITFSDREITEAFWLEKLSAAYQLRKKLFSRQTQSTTAYRMVHGEGDMLPGLIIDYYDGILVIQGHHLGIIRELPSISNALQHLLGNALKAIYNKSSAALHGKTEQADDWIFGGNQALRIKENGLHFEINLEKGQKTGFFLDQRDNRTLLQRYCQGKEVLNTFCYSGGFSVYALAAGANRVTSVDISSEAIALCQKNLELNGFDSKTNPCLTADVLKLLQDIDDAYEVIILDPPAFAKNIRSRHNAVQAYKRLNAMAMKKIKSGGILFTFSCSQVIDRELFHHTVTSAALDAGRKTQVLHQVSQGADHPVNVFHQETSYLKGLILYVT
ncbi:class I SAM-dependent rRNA methyltransferase [Cyclobacterium jeungdonense]|uniref:Class I SAM-dependent rRNA methyltransferase n=1 Tax=Cyclobacterium jeungdonense TaxID=708087 RepID=A0ABT8CCU2_9BACT|nr:class I SAM-dependent rRNA methyltransferase [Cyclobacterium jeungdonense]MDN3690326.1 class I SAM-dependent rRNA methyltransferase [Cyclobacterium jeungdonense]